MRAPGNSCCVFQDFIPFECFGERGFEERECVLVHLIAKIIRVRQINRLEDRVKFRSGDLNHNS